MVPKHYGKPDLDHVPDHPLHSDLVTRLKKALDVGDKETVAEILCTEVKHVDATIELSNDDWMKSPTAQLHPLVLVGDLKRLKAWIDQHYEDVNMTFEINKNELEWQVKSHAAFGLSGLWSLEYKRELTNPLCISASHGHTACLRHLLFWRADPNAAPGGQGALHEACKGGHVDCVELLLEHKANPNILNDDGQVPLHLCTSHNSLGCAKALVAFGAWVNQPSEETQEAPLHTAAKHGLYEHTHLYLRNGATVDAKNSLGETALGLACREAKERETQESYLRVCRLLLSYGAEVNSEDEEMKTPLHQACKNAHHSLVLLLLQKQADVNALDYNGATPLSCVLQAGAFKRELRPHRTVQTLMNHGSPKIWPTAFVKVLKSCASVPEILEILCNSYPHLPISEKWVDAIPKEDFQRCRPFYESLFRQAHPVRTLQHLCRCALRRTLGRRCHHLIPLLPVPHSLRSYLLLEPEGVLL
ncbi:PREDICTED: ankyrin repeat and SOCS box protein 18 isoform X2 [Gekko japonicus]|uniref:Ankyrin repeat and SOCS box protein 18 isoform X2 n=1 Tax=Gekko japonicus TaxID=146911 RepID=A0ABM1L7D7_GEKJA|nr:PREDICTED: ankyrin repeat and SOCS box protein 18 isoform X2 [Gekko japonicus]